MPRLLVEDALGKTSVIELDSAELIVGRGSDAGVVLEDKRASRRHAAIAGKPGGEYVIRDLNSGNGLFVNGQRVSETALNDGDVILVGHSRLVFESEGGRSVRF